MAAAYIYTRNTIMRTPAQILRILLRIALAFTLVAGALLLATAFFLRQNPHALAEHLADSIRSRTGLECSMGLVDVAMLPVPALAVADVYIHSAESSLSIAYATVRPSFSALLRGEFEPGDITLLRPEVSITRDNLPLPGSLGETQPSSTHNPAPLLAVPDMLQNCRIIVQHGSIEIITRDGHKLHMTDIRTDISPQSPSTLDGWFSVGTATLWEKDRISAQVDSLQVDMSGAVLDLHRGSTGRIRLQGRGFAPESLRIAHMDINVEQRTHSAENKDPSGTASATVQGSFPWKGQDIPFHVEGTGKNTGQGTFAIEAADLGLDKDRLRMEAVVTLPRAGQPADVLPSMRGKLTLHKLSLVQWFGFGRVLPPGLQKTLDNLSGSLDFICNRQGLQVPHLQVAVAGTSFEGQGSVASWASPVIFIDAKSTQLSLDTALPESRGKFPAALVFAHLPLTPKPGSADADTMPGPDINYDIRLAVDSVQYGPLHVEGARFRCVPQGKGLVDMTFGSSLYGGNLEGSLLLGGGAHSTTYAIKTQLKNIAAEKPLHLLTGSKWLGGRLSASAQWKTEGKSIAAFLNNLTGSTTLRMEEGYYDPSISAAEAGKIPFSRLELSSKLRGPKSAQDGSEVSAKLPAFLTFEGEWQGLMHTKDWQASVRMDGPLSFSRTKGLPLYFQKVPASVSLHMQKELTGLSQPIKTHASGRFSFHTGNKTLDVEDAHMTAEGLELRGNIQSTLSDLSAKGDVSIKSTQLRRVLGLFDSASLTSSLPATALQTVDVQARMHLTPTSLRMEKMRATLDSTHVAGTLEGQWNARPLWKFDLNADSFDLALYRKSATAGAAPSTTPWNLKPMQSVDAQGTLRISTARLFKLTMQNLHVPVRLNKGLLECTTLRAQLYGAPLTGNLRAEVKKGLFFKLGLQAYNVNMLPLTMDQGLSTVLAGRAAFNSSTQGTLLSAADFPAALNGEYSLEVLNGYFQSRKANAAGNAANGGSKTAFNFLRGTGQMTQGTLRNNDFIMDGSSMRVSGQGWINFGTQQLDYTALVRMGNIAEFPVRYSGPLSNPQRQIQAGKAIVDTLGQLGTDVFGLVGDVLSTPFKFFR